MLIQSTTTWGIDRKGAEITDNKQIQTETLNFIH